MLPVAAEGRGVYAEAIMAVKSCLCCWEEGLDVSSGERNNVR